MTEALLKTRLHATNVASRLFVLYDECTYAHVILKADQQSIHVVIQGVGKVSHKLKPNTKVIVHARADQSVLSNISNNILDVTTVTVVAEWL